MWSPRLRSQNAGRMNRLLQTSSLLDVLLNGRFMGIKQKQPFSSRQFVQRKPSVASHYVGTITGAGLKTRTLRLRIWTEITPRVSQLRASSQCAASRVCVCVCVSSENHQAVKRSQASTLIQNEQQKTQMKSQKCPGGNK